MSTVRTVNRGIILGTFLIVGGLFSSCSRDEISSVTIVTGGSRGSYQVVGRTLARIVNESQASNAYNFVSAMSSGSVANINAISAGEAQFGLAQADHQYQAVNGLGEWKNNGPQEDLRAVFSIFTESVTLITGRDSDIRTVSDLNGKFVDIGSPGSGTQRNAIDALRAAGIDWEDDIQAHQENQDDRLEMFMQENLDAFFFTVGHPNREVKFATFSIRGARIIPLMNIDSLVDKNPYYFKTVIPTDFYPRAHNDSDIETIGVSATLLTSANVSEEVVYAFTKSVFENLGALAEFDTEFDALLNERYLEGLTAQIHPGALKYYQEIGLDTP